MRSLALALLFVTGCGGGASSNVVQVPIGAATAPPPVLAPIPTIDRFHVVATGKVLWLAPIDGAVLATNGALVARLGDRDVAETFAAPAGSATPGPVGYAVGYAGRWPDEVWSMAVASVGCRGRSYSYLHLEGKAWKPGATPPRALLNGGPLEWTFRRWLAQGDPKPSFPDCPSEPHVSSARASNGVIVATASCGGKTRSAWWAPGQADGTVLDGAIADESSLVDAGIDGVAASSPRDIYLNVHSPGRASRVMHFDGAAWTETPLPPSRTESPWIMSMSVAPRGTLWMVTTEEAMTPSSILWRRDPGKAWIAVELGKDLVPDTVYARGDADVWVVAAPPSAAGQARGDVRRVLLHGGAPPARTVDLDAVTP